MSAPEAITALGRDSRASNSHLGATSHVSQPPTSKPEALKSNDRTFGFGDFIDVINPLQHIPGVAEIYRAVTNDQISDQARKAGNAIYGIALGGPIGFGAMLAYNALGDRFEGSNRPAPPDSKSDAIARSAETTSRSYDASKPESLPEELVSINEVSSEFPGNRIAPTASIETRHPLDLARILGGNSKAEPNTVAVTETDLATKSAGASSVAYVDHPVKQEITGPVMPDEDGLGHLATHKSNHLPLDVLKALQERYAKRTASQQS